MTDLRAEEADGAAMTPVARDNAVALPSGQSAELVDVSPDIREQLQQTLGAAYTLERELGGGGMSKVFVAHVRHKARWPPRSASP